MAAFDDVPGFDQPLYVDARNEADRQVVGFLRAQHLPGVDTDDEAALSLEIEQARLVMVAAGAVLSVAVTQMLTLTRGICIQPLYVGLPLLVLALLGSWTALPAQLCVAFGSIDAIPCSGSR